MAKLPSLQFYPGDWKRDAGVQALNYEERGVWFELLMIMFEASPRGKLTFSNGTPIPECAVASMLGLDNQKYNQILSKLLKFGVASKEEDTGIIYCRRMVRDAELSKKRAEAGKMGGNPNLLKQNSSKPEAKRKQNRTPSSSYSISLNKEKNIEKKESGDNPPLGNPSFEISDFVEAGKDPSVALDEADAAEAYDYYAAQGFVRSNGQPITRIEPLLRAWKRNKGIFTQPANKSQTSSNLDALKAVYRSKMARDCSGYLLPSVFDNKVLETKTLDEFKTLVGTTDYEFYLSETRKPKGFK